MSKVQRPDAPAYILIVDDHPATRDLLQALLTSQAYTVRTADAGRAALALVASEPPDLILLDVSMPGRDGLEICRQLKSNDATVHIPVVLITAQGEADDRVRGIKAGADDLLLKPINPEELMARVASLLRSNEMRRSLEAARLELEISKRRALRQTFERYVAPQLVEEILSTPGLTDQSLSDQQGRRDAVVMFADLRGFTSLAESLPPSQVVALLNQFFTLLTHIAHQHAGTIFNMAGDAMMIGFNVPFAQTDAVLHAALVAREMLTVFATVSAEWEASHGVEVGLGVGIHRGEVVAGNVGSPSYMSFTLIGDTVNTAARLTARARAGELLFTVPVRNALEGTEFEALIKTLPPTILKGKAAPTQIFCVSVTARKA